MLNKRKEYYKNNKERLRKQERDRYKSLSEEEKNKKREYGKNRYHNMSQERKQKLKEYQKEYQNIITRQKSCWVLCTKLNSYKSQESVIKTNHKI